MPDYEAIFHLLAHIDEQLSAGRLHIRNHSGKLLSELDQVVYALQTNTIRGITRTDAKFCVSCVSLPPSTEE